jgi:hypothetical protein
MALYARRQNSSTLRCLRDHLACRLSVYPFVSVHLSVYLPLIFVIRLMRSPCCLCSSPLLLSKGPLLVIIIYNHYLSVCLYLRPPKFFYFLCGPWRTKGKQANSSSQSFCLNAWTLVLKPITTTINKLQLNSFPASRRFRRKDYPL